MDHLITATKTTSGEFVLDTRKDDASFDTSVGASTETNHWKMYMAGFIACLASLAVGAAMGYSSPALVSMAQNGSNFEPLDKEEKTWIGSVLTIGALLGGLAAGPFIDRFGRRTLLISAAFPFTIGWILIAFSGKFSIMVVGRLFTGFCSGALSLVVPVYLSETASPKVRGFFGSCLQLAAFVGTLVSFSLGIVVGWKNLALICGVLPVIVSVGMFYMPESPRYLLIKRRRSDAVHSIEFLNGRRCNSDLICKHMEANINDQPTGRLSWREVTSPAVVKPLLLSLMLMVFQQWCGFNGVQFYAGDIFIESGFKAMSPLVCSIVLGVAQLLGTFTSLFLIDRIGRRVLLVASGGFMALGLTSLAIFFLLKERYDDITSSYGWVSVVSLSIYCAAFAIGYGPIAWLIMSEIFPVRVRGPASSLSTAFNWTNCFLVTKTIETMKNTMGVPGTYFFYDAVCLVGCLFVIVFLPETNGRSLEDIEKCFASKKVQPLNSVKIGSFKKLDA